MLNLGAMCEEICIISGEKLCESHFEIHVTLVKDLFVVVIICQLLGVTCSCIFFYSITRKFSSKFNRNCCTFSCFSTCVISVLMCWRKLKIFNDMDSMSSSENIFLFFFNSPYKNDFTYSMNRNIAPSIILDAN